MFIVGMAAIAAGYTLIYYGVAMWRAYSQDLDPTKKTVDPAIPLGFLLGLTHLPDSSGNLPTTAPPFTLNAGSSGGAVPGSNAVTPSTGSTGGAVSL